MTRCREEGLCRGSHGHPFHFQRRTRGRADVGIGPYALLGAGDAARRGRRALRGTGMRNADQRPDLIFGSQNIPAGRFPADAGVGPFLPCREVPAFPLPSGRDGWAGVSRTAAPPMIRRKVYVCDPWLLDLLALRLADASLLRAHRLLRRGPDPLYAGGEAGAAALHDEEQAQHDPHEHGLRPAAGDPEALRQQPRDDGGGASPSTTSSASPSPTS